ncbi:MAG: nucleoside-diphosphate kinase [Clostridia bacterium]|nr:nucleoside-diphosphate kinase [Clostridia bacterium]
MLDSLKLGDFERSLFMIKPDSYKYKNEILNELRDNNFELQYIRDVILSKNFLGKLYSAQDDEIVNLMNVEYFLGKTATIGIAAGESCKERLFELCGDKYAPDMCDKNSIRYKYSTIRKPILLHGHEFYINAIHRSLPQDAENEIELYMNEYIRNNIKEEDIGERQRI